MNENNYIYFIVKTIIEEKQYIEINSFSNM